MNPHKVLLIEDNPGDARLVEILLGESDLVDCCFVHKTSLGDGMAALESGEKFEAVLLDLTLPDSRGLETLERLLTQFPNNNVIVLTGLSDKTIGLEAVRFGAQDFLVKGAFDADTLAKTLRFSIERNRVLQRLEETQRLAHIGSWEYSFGNELFTASAELFRLFGLSSLKRHWHLQDLQNPSSPLHLFVGIHEQVRAQGEHKQDLEIELPDGRRRFLYLQGKLTNHNQDQVVHGIVQDITERRQTEELKKARDLAERSARMKEQFIASISHEMRTPMNAILGMSNILIQMDLNEEQHNLVRSIKQSSEILLGVVNDILEISSIQNGKIVFDYAPFHLQELLDTLVNVMQYKAQEKDIYLEIHRQEGIPDLLVGDKLRLNQVLYNLVGNAIKFTDEGFVKLHIEKLEPKTPEKVHLRFTVEDSGIGIPEDKIPTVFEAFTRIRQKDRIYEGTGLGLSICKNLVEQQGGTIGATSEVGKGSKFFFTLEFEPATEESLEAAPPQEETIELLDENEHFSLLLVEDHKMNQLVARKTLQRRWPNIDLTIADNGKEAIEWLKKRTFDLVLMDIQMPVMDGYEATQHIRNHMPPDIAGMYVLAMTAHAHISKEEKFKEYGMDDYVLKPFEPEDLFRKISKYVRLARAKRAS